MGVPTATNNWGNCNPNEKKNTRTRCSAIITSKNTNTLIDTSPDLRLQLLDNKIRDIKRVIYTHMHADQTHGINDLRPFYLKNKKKIDIYADKITSKYLKSTFNYCFNGGKGYGFITPQEGDKDLFVHMSSIQMDGYKTLNDGQTVDYEVGEGEKGPCAINVVPK